MANTEGKNGKSKRWPLIMGALGIVYGDIGTSPLYTIRECLAHAPGEDRVTAVMGSLSLVFWALTFVVCIKYIAYVTCADNKGEGGIFALLALRLGRRSGSRMSWDIMLILAGAALLYGDGMITPAISVLAAAEGLKAINPHFHSWVVPLSVGVLFALFWCQHKGSGKIGGLFGPIMFLWFCVLGLLGLWQIVQHPAILHSLNPTIGLGFLFHHSHEAVGLLGAVVLAVTGAEALYADMGHFGRRAIVWGWYGVAFPGLVLNYFGQGAYVMSHPEDLSNPFFAIAPSGIAQIGLVALSFAACTIASQALISGTFSISQQAVQLGYLPRIRILHTSEDQHGQIYIPSLNWLLGFGCIALVIGFGSSDRLASAYGVAVTGTMAITTFAFYDVVRRAWKWSAARALSLCGIFLIIDLAFLGANIVKVHEGGWLPLVVGAVVLVIMHTWKRGRSVIAERLSKSILDPDLVVKDLKTSKVHRVPGVAVFMAATPRGTPVAMLHHLKANRCLHQTVVLLSFITEGVPWIDNHQELETDELGSGVWRVVARFGYMESPDAMKVIRTFADQEKLPIRPHEATFYFNRETILSTGKTNLWRWQKEVYRGLSQNAHAARDYFKIPANQIVEMGLPIQL